MPDSNDVVPQSGDIAIVLPAQDFLEIIECPVCNGVPYPPIYNCINGHITCNYCRPKLQHCGICRQPFWEGRNYLIESLVSKCQFYCNYKEAGCSKIVLGELMKVHLATCEFGPKRPPPAIVPPLPFHQWMPLSNGELPPHAIQGGFDDFGNKLYVARANHEGGMIPGNYNTKTRKVHIPWGGMEHDKTEYEILAGTPEFLQWVPANHGNVPTRAILGGTSDGENLYVGRICIIGNSVAELLGKVHPSHGVCYAPFEGNEKFSRDYEVLVFKIP